MFGRSQEGWNRVATPGEPVANNPRARYSGTKTNPHIERWVSFRETLVYTPSMWTRKRLASLAVFGGALPALLYVGLVRQGEIQDVENAFDGRVRTYWGGKADVE